MKIAADGNFQAATDFCLQFIAKLPHMRKIEKIFVVVRAAWPRHA